MNKTRYSGTATPVAFNDWNDLANSLDLTLSQFIECVTTLHVLNSKNNISQNDVESYWNGMPRNLRSNLTGDFIQNVKHLHTIASFELLKFFYSANLLGLSFSTSKQANVYTNGEFKFYLAVVLFRSQYIDSYIINNGYNFTTLGNASQPNSEYIYISKKQNFNNPNNINVNFSSICSLLGVSTSADIIKIHYMELHKLSQILNQI